MYDFQVTFTFRPNLLMLAVDARIVIENVVATTDLGRCIDLDDVSKKLPWWFVEYSPRKFPDLVFRLKKPKTASLIFSTGKIVCTGARSEEERAR
jgi:transcription initiation factor TFIID TATA-box-binding protein